MVAVAGVDVPSVQLKTVCLPVYGQAVEAAAAAFMALVLQEPAVVVVLTKMLMVAVVEVVEVAAVTVGGVMAQAKAGFRAVALVERLLGGTGTTIFRTMFHTLDCLMV